MLNHLWFAFFVLAALSGAYHWLWLGDADVFARMVHSTFEMAKLAFEISIGLTGILCLWLGLLHIAERAGLVRVLAHALGPLFRRLMPGIPEGHPALGSITMNMAANMFGLDNAATPIGLKAMEQMQTLNEKRDTASNAQILFLVLNTSSVTLLPVTIFMYRAQMGAADPASVFLPIVLATSASTLAGLLAVAWVQKLPLFDRVVLSYLGGFILLLSAMMLGLSSLPSAEQSAVSTLVGNLMLFGTIIGFLAAGWWKKVPVYEAFIEGATRGFEIAVRLIPYLVAMLVAIGVLRASGAFDMIIDALAYGVSALGMDTRFVDALPTALMKPFSGSGARAMMLETMQTHGVDSFPSLLAATVQGSTETTFYVLAVYFGAVGITRIRHALWCGLLADAVGIVTAIAIGYWFFG